MDKSSRLTDETRLELTDIADSLEFLMARIEDVKTEVLQESTTPPSPAYRKALNNLNGAWEFLRMAKLRLQELEKNT